MKNNIISPELVRLQVLLLLSCNDLKNSHVLSQFLQFVVEKKLNGEEDEIKEYTIGVNALRRPPDFNPQLDAVVRIHAGRLRRIINEYYSKNGTNDPLLITIPKGTYIPSFMLNGHENSTTSSPELTPDINGLAYPGTPYPEFTHSQDILFGKQLHNKPVIAVLPFHNFGSDNSMTYFINGIGEQLSIDLARFQNISVLSYYSTLQYHEEIKDLQELQKTMGLDYVLTGSVRIVNGLVRLNIQLIMTDNSEIVWAETYLHHFTADNLFDIQLDITDQVLNAVAGESGIIMRRNKGKASPMNRATIDVQEAVYRYYDFVKDYAADKYDKTSDALEKALQSEEENALIYAMLADLNIHTYVNSVETLDTILAKADDLARKAVDLDEHCQHAQKSMAWSFLLAGKKKEAVEAAECCIALNPKASYMVSSMGLGLICLGEYTKGYSYLVRSMHLNPNLPIGVKLGFALYYFNKKNYLESMRWMEKFSMYDLPLFALIKSALQGKIFKKKLKYQLDNVIHLKDKATQIISHLIMDADTKTEIFDGLKLAGLTVK
jgi:TolB-like protein